MEQPITIKLLESFFGLFQARIESYKISGNLVFGTVGWQDEEDKQDFVFKTEFDSSLHSNIKLLCDFILENNLIEGDVIIVSEIELVYKLFEKKWNKITAQAAIDGLCDLEVKMIDDGQETDSFYVHF